MKLIVSDYGHKENIKKLVSIDYELGQAKKSIINNSFHFVGLDLNSNLLKLLKQYDNSEDLKIYFYQNILYITFTSETEHYVMEMETLDFSPLISEMKNTKCIIFGELNNTSNIENFYVYDIII